MPTLNNKIVLRSFIAGIIVVLVNINGMAQERDDTYSYSTEFIWGITKNTNAGLIGGFIFKYSTALEEKKYKTFGVELVNVKHPNEVRRHSITGNTFIWGKTNYLHVIRPQYGRDFILFKKAPQQGVQINANFAAGPSFGFLVPYYIEYRTDGSRNSDYVAYDPSEHRDRSKVLGTGNILQGLGEAKVRLGANVKASLAFEFGTFKNDVTGLEAGFQLEAYPQKIEMVPQAENRSIFPSAFVTLYYGSRK